MDIDRTDLARRRDERLGQRRDVKWGAVFGRVPGWALAWGIGWALFWIVVAIALVVALSPENPGQYVVMPFGGFVGGVIGGLLAGLVTMLSLRHNAGSIHWRHMAPSIPIWGIVGSIGVIVAGYLASVGARVEAAARPACTGDAVDCVGQAFGQALGEAIASAIAIIFLVLAYSTVVVFGIGCVAAWLTVRRIRRLEPGIVGRQTGGVVAGWGCGSLLAAIAGLIAAALLGGDATGT